MSSSWTIAIGVFGALAGSATGAYLTAVLTRRVHSAEWIRNEQSVCLNQVLAEAATIFVELNRRYRRVADDPMNWDTWRRVVAQASLVLPESVFKEICELDRQNFIINLAVKNSPRDLGDAIWQQLAIPWREARERLINASRAATGAPGYLTRTGGRPSPTEEVWDASYWEKYFQELESRESTQSSPCEAARHCPDLKSAPRASASTHHITDALDRD